MNCARPIMNPKPEARPTSTKLCPELATGLRRLYLGHGEHGQHDTQDQEPDTRTQNPTVFKRRNSQSPNCPRPPGGVCATRYLTGLGNQVLAAVWPRQFGACARDASANTTKRAQAPNSPSNAAAFTQAGQSPHCLDPSGGPWTSSC